MRIATTVLASIAGFVVLGAVVVVLPIPPERSVYVEPSPDGSRLARYTWRPAGLLGVVTQDNPWVYVTIRDASSGDTIERHSTWGDVPADACERLWAEVPWHRPGEPPQCGKLKNADE